RERRRLDVPERNGGGRGNADGGTTLDRDTGAAQVEPEELGGHERRLRALVASGPAAVDDQGRESGGLVEEELGFPAGAGSARVAGRGASSSRRVSGPW